jgi:hypothetical protein
MWLILAGFARRISAAMRRRKGAKVHGSLCALAGAVALSLLVAYPATAQDGQQADNTDAKAMGEAAQQQPAPLAFDPAFYNGVRAIDTPNVDNEIVYIDDEGFIHVFDPETPPNMPPLNFRSPDNSWYDAIVADVNGDGDDEIIAIADNGLFKIYDPVVNTDFIQPGQEFNGFYWEELFLTELPGEPLLLAAGEFDGNPLTREIVVVFEEPGRPSDSRIQIWRQPAPPFDGRIWEPLTDGRLRSTATDIATGDLDGDGRDELAIVSSGSGRLSVFRHEANNVLREFWFSASQQRPWTGVAIGNVATDTPLAELIAVRRAAPPFASLVVQRYKPIDQFEDVLLREYLPAPRQVLAANVTGADSKQIFMLRDVPENDARPRLFNSRTGSGANFVFEVRLNNDNGYRVAAAGDLDGDGKDELVLARNTGILIFKEPATSTTLTQTLTTSTNARTLAPGNLDALGRDLLTVDKQQLTFRVAAGQISEPQSLIMTNRTRSGSIPFLVDAKPRVDFVDIAPTSAATPASVIVTANAADLLPISALSAEEQRRLPIVQEEGAAGYGANLVFASPNLSVLNSPLTVPVFIEVTPGIVMRPHHINVMLEATDSSPECRASLPLTAEVQVLGTLNSTFAVSSGADWLSVVASQEKITTDATATLTLTIREDATPLPVAETEVVLTATVPGAAQNPTVRRVPVRIACYATLLHLPLIER